MYLLGAGYFHPPTIIDNKTILSLGIDTTEEWIIEKIGIQERRTVLPLSYLRETKNQDPQKALSLATHSPTDLAEQALLMACQRAGINPSQIGMILCDGCFPSELIPHEAEKIAKRVGIKEGIFFDALTACPASALHAHLMNSLEETSLPEYVACITTAALTTVTDYTDRTDPAIWGDGAAAMIYSARKKSNVKLIDTFFTADPTRCGAVIVDRYGFFHQDGRAVRDFSVRQTVRMLKEVENKHAIDWQRDVFIGHQANVTMLQQITNNREIPEKNHWTNATQFGNQASAGAPIVLAMHWDKLQSGQKIVMAVLGAGLSWGYAVYEVE